MVTASSRSPCRVRRSRPIQTRRGARRCSRRSAAITSRSSSRRRAGPPSRATSSSITTSACRSSIPASATATPASRTAVQALADRNDGAPVVIATDHADLAGVAVTRVALGSNNIPYFAFAANDPLSNGVGTAPEELRVRMQYEKNGQVVTPWRVLTPVDGQYLLPLATELLGNTWLRSAPGDTQALRVDVTDTAGNRTSTLFTFKVQFD